MIKEHILKRYVEIWKQWFNEESLTEFYKFCVGKKLNPKEEVNLIKDWCDRFNRDTHMFSFANLIDLCERRIARKTKLKTLGYHPSAITLSLFEIYAPTTEDAVLKYNEMVRQKTRHSSKNIMNPYVGSKKSYIERHGSLNGYRKDYTPSTSIDYWLKQGLSPEDAQKALRDRQSTFSLDRCIKKYGDEEGRKRWESRQSKWQSSLNNKSSDEKIIINLKKNTFSLQGVMLRGYTEQQAVQLIEERLQKAKKYYSKESITFFSHYFNTDRVAFRRM